MDKVKIKKNKDKEINNNSISGNVTNFSLNQSGNNVVISFNYSWALNGAEPYINGSNQLMLFSMVPKMT